jgi:hypothetical protein
VGVQNVMLTTASTSQRLWTALRSHTPRLGHPLSPRTTHSHPWCDAVGITQVHSCAGVSDSDRVKFQTVLQRQCRKSSRVRGSHVSLFQAGTSRTSRADGGCRRQRAAVLTRTVSSQTFRSHHGWRSPLAASGAACRAALRAPRPSVSTPRAPARVYSAVSTQQTASSIQVESVLP